jgi:Zn-dependent M28 family amino/carboxypeptidase
MLDGTIWVRRRRFAAVLVVAGAVAALVSAPGATARDGKPKQHACAERANVTYRALLDCVTLEGVRAHQAAFQAIADANGGNRAAATPGYEASVDYVVEQLEDTNWDVSIHEFDFTVPQPIQQHTPVAATHAVGGVSGSTLGTVNAAVQAVDINLVPPRASTSGCDGAFTQGPDTTNDPVLPDPAGPDDFAGFTAGNIALIQRGTCSFALKVSNAQAAGASAVIIFNQGNTPDRSVTLTNISAVPPPGSVTTITVPVVGTSFAAGESLAAPGTTATVAVINVPQKNVIAELDGKNDDNVVMAGGHLDSVEEGPGINDNGSGSAALLETAIMMSKSKPENTLRFAWWGAEEAGLIGSQAYVDDLSAAERDRIALYMNYDMIGSPNYIFMVYDADKSTFDPGADVPIPAGSTAIEDVYEAFYTKIDEPYDDTEFSGRSDYEAFIFAGIPSSGLFTGAEEEKTAEQAAIWGGTVGAQFDPCYHEACDTFANNNDHALDVNSDLVAFAALTFAYSTESVNGVPGKKVPDAKSWMVAELAGPEGTFQEE